MIEEIKNISNKKSDFRQFGISVGIVLMIIAGFLFWKERDSFKVFLIIGSILFVLGLAIPFVLKPVYWVWMAFATILGWVMTRVILSLLFYIVITPIGVFARLFGKQFVELSWDKSKDSYWNNRTTKNQRIEDYERQF